MENIEPKSTDLPKVFDACPVCGSTVRLGESCINRLKASGVIHKDSFNNGIVNQVALFDPLHPPSVLAQHIKVPVLLIYWDVCECGMMYCTKCECVDGQAQVKMQPPQRANAPQELNSFNRAMRRHPPSN